MENVNVFIHPTAIIGENVDIGKNTKIWQYCNIMSGVRIGKNCNIGQNVYIESGTSIGNNVKIKNNIAIYSGVIIEDDVFVGPNVVFTNVINPRSFINRKAEFKATHIKKGATVGANATLVCGHTIGKYAMIGAGAVVTHNISDYVLAVGNPAREVGYVCMCGERVLFENGQAICPSCKKIYRLLENHVVEVNHI